MLYHVKHKLKCANQRAARHKREKCRWLKRARLKTKFTSYFVLLLSGRNYSVYYSTKYTSYTTLLRCATGCLIHFSVCKMRGPAVSVDLSSPDESAISEQFTSQKIFKDNRSRWCEEWRYLCGSPAEKPVTHEGRSVSTPSKHKSGLLVIKMFESKFKKKNMGKDI